MAETRKLDRSRTNRQVAGVCGGLAEYFNLDTTLIRICSSCWWLRPVLPGDVDHRPQQPVGCGVIQPGWFTPSLCH